MATLLPLSMIWSSFVFCIPFAVISLCALRERHEVSGTYNSVTSSSTRSAGQGHHRATRAKVTGEEGGEEGDMQSIDISK
jgi:hypothetical protein